MDQELLSRQMQQWGMLVRLYFCGLVGIQEVTATVSGERPLYCCFCTAAINWSSWPSCCAVKRRHRSKFCHNSGMKFRRALVFFISFKSKTRPAFHCHGEVLKMTSMSGSSGTNRGSRRDNGSSLSKSSLGIESKHQIPIKIYHFSYQRYE